jgi:3-hydroxyisobutyrate dehydrogenase-like beta-hydroxyacid dehydrogenase
MLGGQLTARRVALLGLGEAGRAFALDLAAAGLEVRAWDPVVDLAPQNVELASDALDAVAGAPLVLSLNAASSAAEVARSVLDGLGAGVIFADLNSGSPGLKTSLAGIVEPTGALFADVALMAPVPGRGVRTPSLVSGSGAQVYADALAPIGAPIEVLGAQAGEAATRKLLRSVFMKGLAAVSLEALAAADAAGVGDWLHAELAGVYESADAALLTRLLKGSREHAVRRRHEMAAASEMLLELGTPSRMTAGTVGWMAQLAEEGR